MDVLFLPQQKLPNVQLRPLNMSSLKNMCFQKNTCVETTLREFAIKLVLVILCEPDNVEAESRNFSDLEVQRVYTIIPVPLFLPTYIYIGTSLFSIVLING